MKPLPPRVPPGHMIMQPNKLYLSREECLRANVRVIHMWRDKHTGKVACKVIVPIPKAKKSK